MSAEPWQQLDRIFAEALQLPAEEREQFVAHACHENDGQQAEVLSLLAAADESGQFMTKPALDRLAEVVAAEGSSLRPGERLGAYTVLRLLGSGGVGEVWRARDERLGRDVAIKVLLPHFSSDADRLRRFAEEARTAGALNHSNILTVYDVGEHNGIPYLVSECLEGQSLRRRLQAGPLPADEIIAVALGIARGLAAAHRRGIIHRDLKPENIFLRSDGVVKILDFGLAKLQMSMDGPTAMSRTMTGVIVGTAGYMAPEQVRGDEVDARADLFALGVTLYEMLGGQNPFKGASTFETLHAILTVEPPALVTLNRAVPPSLARIVTRLLKKDREARFQSALDVAWALEQVGDRPADTETTTAREGDSTALWRSRWFAWIAAPAITAGVLAAAWWMLPSVPLEPATTATHFTWTLPAGMTLDSAPVVSPDNQHIAFVGKNTTGSRLLIRDLGSLEPTAIAGTDGAKQPFWSPDSTSIGFFAHGQLMKVAPAGGAPVVLAAAPDGRGGAWSRSGVIVFGPDLVGSALARVSADGGPVEAATLLDIPRGDTSHRWPVFLPDSDHFLYFNRSSNDERRGVYIGRADRPVSHPEPPLFRSESEAVYASVPGSTEGALFYVANGRVDVRRVDTNRLVVTGDPRTTGFKAGGNTPYHPVMLSASTDVLAFALSSVPYGNRLAAVSRTGESLRVWDEAEAQNWPRVSPDGRRLARQRIDVVRGNPDIWLEDLERGTRVRVTTSVEPDVFPVWSPDGTRLAYMRGLPPGRPGPRVLNIGQADGTGVVRTLPCPGLYCEPTDWTSDGRHLLVNVRDEKGGDVWMIPVQDGGAARPLLAEPFTERDARLSPNGLWVAYVSEESGRPEVSLRTISGPPTRTVVSGGGGDQPVWRRDGTELFFVDPGGRLRSVSVNLSGDGPPRMGLPVELKVPSVGFGHWGTQYDVSPDGSRIYLLQRNDDEAPREIHVITGWRALLKSEPRESIERVTLGLRRLLASR
jgi:Tol biopolymer transport system component